MSIAFLTGAGNLASVLSDSASASTGISPGKPANTADGDLLFAYAMFRNTGATITAPAGWTMIGAAESTAASEAVFYKPVPSASAETATTYTFTATSGGSSRAIAFVQRVTGVNLADPLEAVSAWATGVSGTVTNASIAAAAAAQLVQVLLRHNSSASTGVVTWASPLVETVNLTTPNALSSVYLGTAPISAGATGSKASSITNQTTTAGILFALNPLVPPNEAPTVSLSPDPADAGQTVTATASDDGTISSWAITGVTPAPTLSGTGLVRTFTAPPLKADATLTVTVTDNEGATGTDTVLVKASGVLARVGGALVAAYRRTL